MDLERSPSGSASTGRPGGPCGPSAAARSSDWGGRPAAEGAVDLETSGLDEIAEHNVGDFTAVLGAGVRLADAQARVRRRGPDARARPAARRRRRRDGRRHDRHRRLRPAAPPLRRRARPRGRHDRDPQRRHGRQVRRQGDQERRRLRPREAVRGLLRDARADRLGGGAAAPAAEPQRDRDRLLRGPGAAGRGGRRARRAPAGGRLASTSPGTATAATCSCASAPPPPSTRRSRPPSGCARLGLGDARAEAEDDRDLEPPARAAALRRTGSCSRSPAARPTCRP